MLGSSFFFHGFCFHLGWYWPLPEKRPVLFLAPRRLRGRAGAAFVADSCVANLIEGLNCSDMGLKFVSKQQGCYWCLRSFRYVSNITVYFKKPLYVLSMYA